MKKYTIKRDGKTIQILSRYGTRTAILGLQYVDRHPAGSPGYARPVTVFNFSEREQKFLVQREGGPPILLSIDAMTRYLPLVPRIGIEVPNPIERIKRAKESIPTVKPSPPTTELDAVKRAIIAINATLAELLAEWRGGIVSPKSKTETNSGDVI